MYCVLLYMICFGDEFGNGVEGILDIRELDWVDAVALGSLGGVRE